MTACRTPRALHAKSLRNLHSDHLDKMAASSFRRDLRLQPTRYRTPSPPRQDVELLTPPTSPLQQLALPHCGERLIGRFHNDGVPSSQHLYKSSHHHRDSAGSGLDVFASIALATKEAPVHTELNNFTRKRHGPSQEDVPQEGGRPAKKIKVASYNGVEIPNADLQTPASAGEQTEVKKSDAELLLFFSRETHSEHQRSASLVSEKILSPTFHNRAPNTYPPVFDESPRQAERKIGWELTETQEVEQHGIHGHDDKAAEEDQVSLVGQEIHPSAQVQDPLPQPRDLRIPSTHGTHTATMPNDETANSVIAGVENAAQSEQKAEHTEPIASTDGQQSQPIIQSHTGQASSLPITNGFLSGIEEAANSVLANGQTQPMEETAHGQPTATPVKMPKEKVPSVCAACKLSGDESNPEAPHMINWITCDACQSWFHFGCAGLPGDFRGARDIKEFRCKACEEKHGLKTTYVRKSSRVHNPIDYAGLNEGILKTSEDTFEHHYIRLFKEGKIKFQPDNFARMRPEDVTPEFLGRTDGWKEPIVIPAAWNPRPPPRGPSKSETEAVPNGVVDHPPNPPAATADSISGESQMASVPETPAIAPPPASLRENPDGLDMVMPHDLTVRQVSELYGPDEKVEVIYVKSQNGEDKPWNMRRWADYYENPSRKVIRNVISLEVSHSALGQLIERPKAVRQLDLQDSIWPDDLKAKGEYPKVQVYCLMSVADCFTDFHIDFGGSSVFYHILKGQKTFFFIPPHEKHLKKYEDWCNSPRQNEDWLGDLTKECYRVDLSEGDTALIPAGWIHSVWTPTDSLVIGGNFLTRMHYEKQIRVTQIEKATNVARKFRYPHFQKVMWYTALRYLDEDPLPDSVRELLISGQPFTRERPTYEDSDPGSGHVASSPEWAHKRYYPKAELDGLPSLGSYLVRTVRIAMGCIDEAISAGVRSAVKKSIPKTPKYGEPLDAVKMFAMWCAWKRGNEALQEWAHPDFVPEAAAPEFNELLRWAQVHLEPEAAERAHAEEAGARGRLPGLQDRAGAAVDARPHAAAEPACGDYCEPGEWREESVARAWRQGKWDEKEGRRRDRGTATEEARQQWRRQRSLATRKGM